MELVATAVDPKTLWAVDAAKATVTGATNLEYGATNMTKLSTLNPGLANYPAAKHCTDKGDGWYLPSQNQLMAIWVASGAIPADVSFSEGGVYYWSSTEVGNDIVYVWFKNGYTAKTYGKSASFLVRCVRDLKP